jgi:hypothetical protein
MTTPHVLPAFQWHSGAYLMRTKTLRERAGVKQAPAPFPGLRCTDTPCMLRQRGGISRKVSQTPFTMIQVERTGEAAYANTT